MSLIIQKDLPGTFLRKYPEWPDEGTDSSLRDTEVRIWITCISIDSF